MRPEPLHAGIGLADPASNWRRERRASCGSIRPDASSSALWICALSGWPRISGGSGRLMLRTTLPARGSADMHSFSADPHDTHDRIIGFRNRPRADVTEMYARLPEEGRTRVQPDSGLWILGDFGLGRAAERGPDQLPRPPAPELPQGFPAHRRQRRCSPDDQMPPPKLTCPAFARRMGSAAKHRESGAATARPADGAARPAAHARPHPAAAQPERRTPAPAPPKPFRRPPGTPAPLSVPARHRHPASPGTSPDGAPSPPPTADPPRAGSSTSPHGRSDRPTAR